VGEDVHEGSENLPEKQVSSISSREYFWGSRPHGSRKLSVLKIDFSYYCPLVCDHCLFEASPSLAINGLSDTDIMQVIRMSSEVGSFYTVSLGHQEPFVQFDRLCAVLGWMKSNFDGYAVSLNTTAVWVKSRQFATERLSRLRDLRLETLMVSVDDFHQNQKEVPLEKCIACAQEAQKLGISVIIQCIYTATSHRLEYFRAQMGRHLNADKTEWVESAFCPSGRARKVIVESEWPEQGFQDGCCNIMEVMYVAPNGNVTPCCGGGLVSKGLVAGNVHEKPMTEIVAQVEQDPLMNMIAIYNGPAGLIRTLQEEHPSWTPRRHYTGKCHACFEIMNDPSLVDFLRKSYEKRKVELLLSRLYMEVKEGLFCHHFHAPGPSVARDCPEVVPTH
jgi:hypothetical protein